MGMLKKFDDILREFNKIHNNKYDYSESVYKSMGEKIYIKCPIHGGFWQTPSKHLYRKQGCPECGIAKRAKMRNSNTEEFINKARQLHGDKYDYSKVKYINSRTKVCIICPIHGEFWMTPNKHLSGQDCPQCKGEKISKKLSYTTEWFINEARKVHGNKYDYSKVNYINNYTKVCIICHEKDANGNEHGEFWQMPANHLSGKGCHICNSSFNWSEYNLYQELLKKFSDTEIIYQYSDKTIFDKLSIDIFIPKYKIAIEYQGDQHFNPVSMYGGFKAFIKQVERDKTKYDICNSNDIALLYANFKKATKVPQDYLGYVYRTTEELINKINEIIKEKEDA